MGTRALAVLLLAPSLALAQTAGLLTATPSETGRANCSTGAGESIRLNWTGLSSPSTTNTWRLAVYADTDSCPTTAVTSTASNVIVANQLATAGTATATASIASDVIASKGSVTCIAPDAGPAADVAKKICVWLVVSPGGTETSSFAAEGPLTFQFARPPPPVLNGVRSATEALILDFRTGADSGQDDAASVTFRVYIYQQTTDPICDVVPPPVDPVCLLGHQDVQKSGDRVGGLTNFATYTVLMTAFSSGDNESDPSGSAAGTPKPFESFWNAYQNANGREQGGCGGGGGALSLLALLPLALRRRRT